MDLILNQTKIPRDRWRYGLRGSAATGCGWIAGYNALLLMGKPEAPEAVLSWFVRRRPILNGLIGTTFGSMLAFFRKRGYAVTTAFRMSRFDRLARESDVCVMFYFWRRGWRVGAHYVALQYTKEGFVGYNTFKNSTGPDRYGDNLPSFLKGRHGALPALIALKKA